MAKKKAAPAVDRDALTDEVAELEALVKRRKAAEKALRALDQDEDGDQEDEAQPLPGSELINQVLSELDGDGSFDVTKFKDGRSLSMGKYDLTLWPKAMEELVKVQGGGDYLVIFRRSDGTIAKRIERTYPASLFPAPAAPAPSQGTDMLAMLKIMEDRAARQEAANESLRLEAMKSQQGMMTAMMQMMGAQNKPLINNASELATIAKLFSDGKKGNDLSDLVALKDLLDDLRGEPESSGVNIETDNPMVALIAPILNALGKGLAAAPKVETVRKAAPPAQVAHETTAPVTGPTPKAEAVPPSPSPTVVSSPATEAAALPPEGIMAHVSTLKTAIEAGVTPTMAAEQAWIDAKGRDQVPVLEALVEQGDWTGLKAHVDLVAHVEWLDKFREELRRLKPENAESHA